MKSQNTLGSAKLGLIAAFIGTLVVGTASVLPATTTSSEPTNSYIASAPQSDAPGFVEDIIRH